jgi:hypothetical protein
MVYEKFKDLEELEIAIVPRDIDRAVMYKIDSDRLISK